jgi:hypothetical protein
VGSRGFLLLLQVARVSSRLTATCVPVGDLPVYPNHHSGDAQNREVTR